MKYLTESRLETILKDILPKFTFIRDKSVPNSINKRRRPDFRCDELKTIIEFNGHSHYCKSSVIIADDEKFLDYSNLGYKVFHIPYFVQMSSELIRHIFNIDIDYEQFYPHGFVDKKAVLPADFCSLGVDRFERDLINFDFAKEDIIKTLQQKIQDVGNIDLVLPQSMCIAYCPDTKKPT